MSDTKTSAQAPQSGLPSTLPGQTPDAGRLWLTTLRLGWVVLAMFLFDRLTSLLMHYWLFESLGLEAVFMTNFKVGLMLFLVGVASSLMIIGAAWANPVSETLRRIVTHGGLMAGILGGYLFSGNYLDFVLSTGVDFGKVDPIFGNDYSYYVFTVDALWLGWGFLLMGTLLALVSWLVCSYAGRAPSKAPASMTRLESVLGACATPGTRLTLGILGALITFSWWLSRYDVLTANNKKSSVFSGPSYVDVRGLFSTVNDYHLTAAVTVGITVCVLLALGHLNKAVQGEASDWRTKLRPLGLTALGLLAADFAFMGMVQLRQLMLVTPNEPVVQLEFIDLHIKSTREAFNLNAIQEIPFAPKQISDPLPDVEALLASPAVRNAPLWPGFVSYLDELTDPQHATRVIQTGGDVMVYGPTLEAMRQQQKLRAYYNFLDIDTIRTTVNGEKTMLASAVREVPLLEPQPWLAWWGQQFMLFTHGHGLVTTYMGRATTEGNPIYTSSGIPIQTEVEGLQLDNPRVYYGEGSGSMAYSNVRDVRELDYPTEEGRATTEFPEDVDAGVRLDSLLKRIVFGYKSGQFFDIVFSDLIHDDTRVHFFRTPIERAEILAPFLFFDSDPIATSVNGSLTWIVNGISYSDDYPFSQYEDLGDKSDVRVEPKLSRPHERVNYARDAVKLTVDAYTGRTILYPIDPDDPISQTVRSIYPDLFRDAEDMPEEVRSQLQYPTQLMHLQFDDLFIYYQMQDPMTFFNMEDMWDDGDEVLGAVLDQGHAIRFSIEPYDLMVTPGDGVLPTSSESTQFAKALLFTPEKALNLRAIPMAYQDGDDYGRLFCLKVNKGDYYPGPEQADASFDQDPTIGQQISLWNRRGVDVIRGHTTALIVQDEVIYVEPIFLRSQQNPVTQLKAVCVMFRGMVAMGRTLEEALRLAVEEARAEQAATSK